MTAGGRIAWVDALRGLCAAIVVGHHARTLFAGLDAAVGAWSPRAEQVLLAVSRRNTEAVIVFFVLSGFSIRLSVEGAELTQPAALRAYYLRRARRLLPLYWLSLGVAWLVAVSVAPLAAPHLAPSTLLGNLFFLQTAVGVPGAWVLPWAGNGPLWSLSFEAFFYTAYPWLVRAARGVWWRWTVVTLVAVLGLGVSLLAPNPLSMFCAATLSWYLGVDLAERWLGAPLGSGLWWYAGVCAVSGALRFGLGAEGVWFHSTWVASGVAWVIALCMAFRKSPRAPSSAPHRADSRLVRGLLWLGTISYALYLLHVPVMRAFAATLGDGIGVAIGAVVVSAVVAQLAEHWAARFRARAH